MHQQLSEIVSETATHPVVVHIFDDAVLQAELIRDLHRLFPALFGVKVRRLSPGMHALEACDVG